jgi:hypothetical protein
MGSMVSAGQNAGVIAPVSGLTGKVTPVNPNSPPVPQSMLPMGITNAKPQTQTQTQMLSQNPQMRQTILANKLATLKQNNPQQYSQIVQKVRAQKARGGRVGYADGSQPQINQQQIAMIVTMLKKGADLDTIASVTGVPAQAIQMIVSKLQQGIQQKAKGGITEIDYRDKGGYVPPIGKKERADDIPAMLSNNEFVFTANAVRNAGGGDIKEGAKKMYALMKKLEGKE